MTSVIKHIEESFVLSTLNFVSIEMSSYHHGKDKNYCCFFNIEVGNTRKIINCHCPKKIIILQKRMHDYNMTITPQDV